jgi:hypothetical protein
MFTLQMLFLPAQLISLFKELNKTGSASISRWEVNGFGHYCI